MLIVVESQVIGIAVHSRYYFAQTLLPGKGKFSVVLLLAEGLLQFICQYVHVLPQVVFYQLVVFVVHIEFL